MSPTITELVLVMFMYVYSCIYGLFWHNDVEFEICYKIHPQMTLNDHDMTVDWPFILELGTVDIYIAHLKSQTFGLDQNWPSSLLILSIFLEFRVIFSKSLLSSIILRLKTELDMSESDYNWDASTSLEFWERFLRCIMTLVEEDQVWHIRLS